MDRSVPFILGKGTCLRLDSADIKAVENVLGIGYPHFVKDGIFGSLTLNESLVWRGLRVENQKGDLEHVFTLDDAGRVAAGEAILEYLRGEGATATLNDAILEMLFSCGLFKRKNPEASKKRSGGEEKPPKNLTT